MNVDKLEKYEDHSRSASYAPASALLPHHRTFGNDLHTEPDSAARELTGAARGTQKNYARSMPRESGLKARQRLHDGRDHRSSAAPKEELKPREADHFSRAMPPPAG